MSHYRALIDTLSEHQRDVLGAIAMNQDGGHHPATLRKLEVLGLIESEDQVLGGRFPVTIKRYHVPIPVHMAWCGWCSERHQEEETS